MRLSTLLLLLTFMLSFHTSASAQFGEPKTQASLISEFETVEPGQSFTVALKLVHEPKWHSYFINDGLGIGSKIPAIKWTLPEGWKYSELKFPTPHEFTFNSMKVYGYEGTNYLLTTLTAPTNAKTGETFEIAAKSSWQVCDDKSCLPPRRKEHTLTLQIGDEPVSNVGFAEVTEYNLKYFPSRDLPWSVEAKENGKGIQLKIHSPLPEGATFFEYDAQVDLQANRSKASTTEATFFIGTRNQGNNLGGKAVPSTGRLRGIIHSPEPLNENGNQSFWIDVPLTEGEFDLSQATISDNNSAAPTTTSNMSVPLVFASLFLGGLILNLMPCVFPVIGLKIMGFVQQAGEDHAKIKLHGLTFTAGVLLSFVALAAALFPLRASTTLGAQLQEPWVVFSLILIMLLLALSMAGLFEIGAKATSVGGNLTQKDGLSGSFFSGVLAVVVATPCSAPFLGPAIGVAWNFNGPLFFLSLLMMGVGLATPYILLSFFPALVNKLPRPGAWMESFKQGMSFLLFATVGFLLWVYNGLVGEIGLKGLAIMLGVTLVAAASWVYGRWFTPVKSKKAQRSAIVVSLALFAGGFVLAMPPKESKLVWETWTPQREAELLAAGTPVYVDFTARWCVTCQTNKAAAYTDSVASLFEEKGIVALKADMTKDHPDATAVLHKLDRAAIPVNVLYIPGDDTPHITREILDANYLYDFIEEKL